MADAINPTRSSFEVAGECALLLRTLSRAQRREVLTLLASRDDLRVVSMDRPLGGRVDAPAPASNKKSKPRKKKANKPSIPVVTPTPASAGVPAVPAAIAATVPLRRDPIVVKAQKERDTIVSELKVLSVSSESDPAEISRLIDQKTNLEALIRARRAELRIANPAPK